jgi:hypothetical protein
MGNALVSYRLNEDMHLGGTVRLSLEIAIDQEQSETLRKNPAGPKRCRLEQEGEDTKSNQERSLEPLTKWLEGSRPIKFRARADGNDRRRLTKEHLERRTIAFTETLHGIAEEIPLRLPERITTRKSKERRTVRAKTLRKTAQKAGTLRSRRNAWSKMLQEHEQLMRNVAEGEKSKWEEETEKIEEDLQEGDWAALWKRNKSKEREKNRQHTKVIHRRGRQTHLEEKPSDGTHKKGGTRDSRTRGPPTKHGRGRATGTESQDRST